MFYLCETIFRTVFEELRKETRLIDRIAEMFVKEIQEKYPQAPPCHIELIFKRFAKM